MLNDTWSVLDFSPRNYSRVVQRPKKTLRVLNIKRRRIYTHRSRVCVTIRKTNRMNARDRVTICVASSPVLTFLDIARPVEPSENVKFQL